MILTFDWDSKIQIKDFNVNNNTIDNSAWVAAGVILGAYFAINHELFGVDENSSKNSNSSIYKSSNNSSTNSSNNNSNSNKVVNTNNNSSNSYKLSGYGYTAKIDYTEKHGNKNWFRDGDRFIVILNKMELFMQN